MSLYVVKPDSLDLEQAHERSPVISLLTDCLSAEDIPSSVRAVSDRVKAGDLSVLQNNQVPGDSDAAILWMAGDKLLEGSGIGLRRSLLSPGCRSLVAVHLPCFPEVDLIGLQPRLWKKGPHLDTTLPDFRIAGAITFSPEMEAFLEESPEIWARLYLALLGEQNSPGSGVEMLSQMWRQSSAIPKLYASLLLRNLIALLIRHGQHDHAENLLKLGMDYYPRYAELPYLAALLCASKERYSEIPGYVDQATKNPDPSFLGSGGEYSYRSLWLLGWVAELAGNQMLAVQCYLAGAQVSPAYPPSVFGLLRQRLSYQAVQGLQQRALGALARREPQYREMIFHYLLLHRQIGPARRLAEFSGLTEEERERYQKLLGEMAAAFRPAARPAGARPGVTLIGPVFVHSSLARINRELVAALEAANSLDVTLEPSSYGEVSGHLLPHSDAALKGFKQRAHRLDLTIRHHWPPDLQAAPCGKLAVILPWEYGSVSVKWVEQIEKNVDELWVPSEFCRQVFIRSGVRAGKVQAIPNGIDPEIFKPEGPAWRPEGCRKFVFLFVGGAIQRKGADLLWNAYSRAFTPADDVTLVIKDIGSSTFYKGMTLLDPLSRAAQDMRLPHMMILTEELDEAKLAALYRGCNAFVLPYRGEGFGMPLAEALACGRPVITTGLGPAREFCPPEASYFLPARETEILGARHQFGPMSGPFTWFEPDVNELAKAMRHVFEHPDETARRGTAGTDKVRSALRWARITGLQMERIRRLVGEPALASGFSEGSQHVQH